jgi:putative peptidoglycan lipid II flippase
MHILTKIRNKLSSQLINNNDFIKVSFIYLSLAAAAFIKDAANAMYLGTTSRSDNFYFASFIPDAIGNTSFFSALSIACVPIFISIVQSNSIRKLTQTAKFISILYFFITLLATIITLFTIIIIIFCLNINVQNNDFIKLLLLLLPTIALFPSLAIYTAYHQVLSNYIRASMAPVILNLVLIIFPVICIIFRIDQHIGIYILSIGTYFSIITMLFYLLPSQIRRNLTKEYLISIKKRSIFSYINRIPHSIKNFSNCIEFELSKKVFIYQLPMFMIILLNQFVLFIERQVALSFSPGSLSATNYSYRLSQFPVWVFAAAIAMTSLTKILSNKNTFLEIQALKNTILKTFAISIPITIFFYIFRDKIISILFLRGSFDKNSLTLTIAIFSSYVFSIPFLSANSVMLKYFTAKGRLKEILPYNAIILILWAIADIIIVPLKGLYIIGVNATVASFILMILFIKHTNAKQQVPIKK